MSECKHQWVHMETKKWTGDSGSYNTHWFRVDSFYCTKCLEMRDKKRDDYQRESPDWYR